MYAFLFDKKSLALVVLGFSLVGLLLFGAGLAVGTHWGSESPQNGIPWATMAEEANVQSLLPESLGLVAAPSSTESSSAAGSTPTGTPATESTTAPEAWSRTLPTTLPTAAATEDDGTSPALSSSPADSTDVTVPLTGTSEGTTVPPSSTAPDGSSADDQAPAGSHVPAGSYVVQVGTFTYSANAESRRQAMEDHGYDAYVQVGQNSKGHTFYAVRVGQFTRFSAAKEIASAIRDHLGLTPEDHREVSVLRLPNEPAEPGAPSI